MSFTDAPATKALVLGLVGLSIAASVFDIKHYFYISIGTHFLRYGQLWRMLTYQLCYTNSSEVLFGAMSLYHMRMVERFWGSRKYVVSTFVPLKAETVSDTHQRKTVLHPPSRTLHSHYPAHLPHCRPTTALLRRPGLHTRRTDTDPLCHSRAVPRRDPADLQVQGRLICQLAIQRQRRHQRVHLLGQVDAVSHGLAAGPLPVARFSPRCGDWLGSGVFVAQRSLACGGCTLAGSGVGGRSSRSEEERPI